MAQERWTVTGTVSLAREGHTKSVKTDNSGAVVSLKSVSGATPPPAPRQFEIRQQNKRFDPHVLAVPVGSRVAFPNLDPFFHNVFSMFDGKRFDLGLYEAGASHSVTFDRAGICYIFCNIHPEMSALVLVLDTPYFAVSDRAGAFTIPDVTAGKYLLSVWHERAKSVEAPREITVSAGAPPLRIRIVDSGQIVPAHKNKYGRDYEAPAGGYRKR